MKFTLHVDPNEQAYVLAHDKPICDRLQTALMLLLQELHEADRKKEVFIGHGMDGDAVRQTNEREQRAAEAHAETFKPLPEEVARQKAIDSDVAAARKAFHW
jgi:hypothetical protein